MAAVLAAGTVTGPVFAADYTTTGEILTEEGNYDYLSENGGLTVETVQEERALSTETASEADSYVSESAAEDQESVSVLSTVAADWSEDGNTMDAQLPGEAEVAGAAEETEDSADSSAAEATDQAAIEETSSEAGEETEAEAVENAEMPDDADASADGAASIDETEEGSSGITDDEEIIADETPVSDQETDENPAPVQEDNALTEDQAAADNPSESLTEDPATVAEPALADDNEGQNADAEVLKEPEAQETVSEEKAAYSDESYNPISVDETSLEIIAGEERGIDIGHSSYEYYDDEYLQSANSSNNNVLTVNDVYSTSFTLCAKKPGNAKVTVEGTYGTVLTIQVKVDSFLEKSSVTVKADNETSVSIYEYDSVGYCEYPYYDHYSVSSSNKNIATGSLVYDEDNYCYVLGIKGISLGNAVITVKDNETGGISTISVKVEKPSFSLNETEISFKASEFYYLDSSGSNIKTAVSSNTNVFTTEKIGDRTICLNPVKTGKATVTVTNNFGETRKATVTVTSFLAITNLNLTAGNKRDIYESSLFSGSDYWEWGKNLTTSNQNIATVSGKTYYDSFVFTGKYPGKATINVRCGRTGVTVPLTVTVEAPSFKLSTSKLIIDKVKTWYVTASGSDIGKVSSSNTKVLKVSKVNSRKVQFNPVGQGKATVTITSIYGVKRTVTVTVSYKYFRAMLTSKTRTGTMVYGSTVLKGITAPAAAVSVRIGGKTYSCKADSKGNYAIQKIPVVKYGTAFKLSFKLGGQTITKTVTVGKGKSTVYTPYYTYMNTTSVPVQITNAHAGDQLVIQIGEKKYYKNITSTVSKTTVKVPISKPGKYGIKMAVKLKNKFKQDLVVFYDYVYLSDTVYVGYTKDKVKWLTYWNDPVEKSYTAYGETW